MRKLKLILFVMIMAGYSSGAIAQTFTWVAPGSGFVLSEKDWSTRTNWEVTGGADDVPGDYPNDPNDHVVFDRHRSVEKCVIDVSDAKCGNITSNLDAGSFIMDGKTMEVYGNIKGIKVLSNSIRNGSVIIMKGSLDAGMSEIDIPILQVKKDSKTTKVEIGVNVIVDELIISQAYIETTGAGDIETIKNFTLDADGISGAESTININIGGQNSFILKGGTASDPSLFKVVSGTLTIANDDKIILKDVCNFEQTGGKIIGADAGNLVANKADYPLIFGGPGDVTISGTALNIDAALLINKADGNKVTLMSGSSDLTIGNGTTPKNFMISNGTLENNSSNPISVGHASIVGNGQLKVITTGTNLQVHRDFRTDEFDATNAFPAYDAGRSTGITDAKVTFVGTGESKIIVDKKSEASFKTNPKLYNDDNTQFSFLDAEAQPGNTKKVILDPSSGPLIVHEKLEVKLGVIFMLNNVTDAFIKYEIDAPGDDLADYDQPVPNPDMYVGGIEVVEGGTLDAYTNEPARENKTISIHVTKDLVDNNSGLPTENNGFYTGPNEIIGARSQPDNGKLPTVVFSGSATQAIDGNNQGLRNTFNTQLTGINGLYLPNVIVAKDNEDQVVALSSGQGLKIMGHLNVFVGTLNISEDCTLLFGNRPNDRLYVFGRLVLKPGVTLYMNTYRSRNGGIIRVLRGGYMRLLGDKTNQIKIQRDGTVGNYYAFEVFPGGMIDMAYTELLYQADKNSGLAHSGSGTDPEDQSLGGLKVHFGAIVNPKHGTTYNPQLGTSPTCPQYEDLADLDGDGSTGLADVPYHTTIVENGKTIPVFYNFSYCNFAQGANHYTALTINTGQVLNIRGAVFTGSNNARAAHKNVVANPYESAKIFERKKPNNWTNIPVVDEPHSGDLANWGLSDVKTDLSKDLTDPSNKSLGYITMIESAGAIGGVSGEGFDGGSNDDSNPIFDRIIWQNSVPIYWVGNYKGGNFAQRDPDSRGTSADVDGGTNQVHTDPASAAHGDPEAWTNWRNWSLDNEEYYNPGNIYPGQTTAPAGNNLYIRQWPGNPDHGKVPSDTLKQFDVFITHTSYSESADASKGGSRPTVSSDISVIGSITINSGLSNPYNASSPGTVGKRLTDSDLKPQVESLDRYRQQTLTVTGSATLITKSSLNITSKGRQGELIVTDNGVVRVGQNVYAQNGSTDFKGHPDDPAKFGSLILDGKGSQEYKCGSWVENFVIDKMTGKVISQNAVRVHDFTMKNPEGYANYRPSSGSPVFITRNMLIEGGTFEFDQSNVTVGHNWTNTGGYVSELQNIGAKVTFKGNNYNGREHSITTRGQIFPEVVFLNNNANVYTIEDNMKAVGKTTVGSEITVQTVTSGHVNIKTEGLTVDGTVDLKPSTTLQIHSAPSKGEAKLLVNSTGKLIAIGTPEEYVKITRDSTAGYFQFKIDGKNSIRFYNIQFVDKNGIDLTGADGATTSISPGLTKFGDLCPDIYVGSFSDGSITNGEDVDGATYINLPPNYQTQDIHNCNFPLALTAPNTSNVKLINATGNQADETDLSTTSPPITNIRRNQLVFKNATGVFSGEGNDKESIASGTWDNADKVIVWGGEIKKWDGGGSDNKWSTPENWTGNTVPNKFQAVFLDHEYVKGNYNVVLDGTYASTAAVCRDLSVVSNSFGEDTPIKLQIKDGGKIDVFRSNPCTGHGTSGTLAVEYGGDFSADAKSILEVTDKGSASAPSLIRIGKGWSNAGTFTYGPAGSEATVNFYQPTGGRIVTTGPTFSPFYNLIFNQGYSENNDKLFVDKDFTINDGATYDASDIEEIEIHIGGNWTNNHGTFLPKYGRVFFDGKGPQSLEKNGYADLNENTETFYNVTFNKVHPSDPTIPVKLTLNSRMYIEKEARLQEGMIVSKEDKEIIFDPRGSWIRPTSPSPQFGFVSGPAGIMFTKNTPVGNTDYRYYPLGTVDTPAGGYTGGSSHSAEGYGLNIRLNAKRYTTFTMELVKGDPEDQDSDGSTNDADNGALHYNDYVESTTGSIKQVAGARLLPDPYNMVSKDIFFRVRNIGYPTGGKDDAIVPDIMNGLITLNYNTVAETSQQNVNIGSETFPLISTNITEVGILQDFDPTTDPAASARGVASSNVQIRRGRAASGTEWRDLGGIADLTADNATIKSEVPFKTLGNGQFTFGWYFVPLPVEFVQLSAQKVGQKVELSWIVDNETGIQQYIVERRNAKGEFFEITRVDATEDVASIKKYVAFDNAPLIGTNYYRLQYNDAGGKHFSKVVAVQFTKDDFDTSLVLFPNPTNSNQYSIRFAQAIDAKVKVEMISMVGTKVFEANYQGNNTNELKISPNTQLKAGVYLVKITFGNQQVIKRLVVTD